MLFDLVRRAGTWFLYPLVLKHGEEAGCIVTLFLLFFEGRLVLSAVVLGARTAVVEVAPAGRVRGRWHVSGYDHTLALALLLGVGDRDGREQRSSVGVTRLAVQGRPVGDLYDLAQVHH